MSNGPIVTDPATNEPIDGGCAKHSDHWLAKAVRQNRVGLGLPPQECQHRTGCPADPSVADAGDHILTEYGTTRCPTEHYIAANVDDGVCSACGASVADAGTSSEEER